MSDLAPAVGPSDPTYLDEKSTRDEFTRVADVCTECRNCVDLCGVFPTLFDLVALRDGDAGRLAPADQDEVVDACFHCDRCVDRCPYAPGLHDLSIDVPGLVLRVDAVRHATGQIPARSKATTWALTRTGIVGRIVRAPAGSLRRRAVALVTDLSATCRVPPIVRPSLSQRLRSRSPRHVDGGRGRVTAFPTCIVEHQAPWVGEALVDAYERSDVSCSVSRAGCCGAPWLHAGDIGRFRRIAERNVEILADEIRRHGDVVVPEPECRRVLTREYPRHVRVPDAAFVAERTRDATDHLAELDPAAWSELELGGRTIAIVGSTPRGWTRVLAADVRVIDRNAGVGVTWGWRRQNEEASRSMTERLAATVGETGADLVIGASHLENTALADASGAVPLHPLEMAAGAERPPHH